MITIAPYDPRWVDDFQRLAAALREALGALALRIDHIGSTAVPGLAAKDVIDVQVTVAALAEPETGRRLRAAGFAPQQPTEDHVPPGAAADPAGWQKRLFKERPGERRANIHVREQGRPNQRYALLMRDHLRAHRATADAYAELKRRLAAALADDEAYPDVKDPAVDLIYLAAEDWARRTGWMPDH